MDMNQIFSARLSAIRKERNMSQEEFSKKTGVSRVGLIRYESGDRLPNIEILQRIAAALNISADYLIGNTDTESLDVEAKAISQKTGLNEKSLRKLRQRSYFGIPPRLESVDRDYIYNAEEEDFEEKTLPPTKYLSRTKDLINLLLDDESEDLLRYLIYYMYLDGGETAEQEFTLAGAPDKLNQQDYFTFLLFRIQRELEKIKSDVDKNKTEEMK